MGDLRSSTASNAHWALNGGRRKVGYYFYLKRYSFYVNLLLIVPDRFYARGKQS